MMSLELLKQAIRNGKAAHAYVFAGPKGCGRSRLAKDFAKALNCEDPPNAPCGSCRACQKIEKNIHPDVRWIIKEEKDSEIKIEKIRELGKGIILKPYEGKYKVYIVVDAEMMSPGAANAVLKTLEEPPPDSTVILITEEPQGLLPTILSRCQMVRLKPVRPDTDASLLSGVLEEFADDGCIGSYTADNRGELSMKLSVLAGWYRDLMVFSSTGDEGLLVNREEADKIKKNVKYRETREFMRMLEVIVSTKQKIDSKVNPKLALSAMLNAVR